VLFVSFGSFADDVSIRVLALFSNKAMLTINDSRHIIKKGEVIDGVKLISADGRSAVIELENGDRRKLTPNQSINSVYKKAQRKKLTLYSNNQGMFKLNGKINGKSTRFLLDTGATFIALSADEADSLNLDYESGKRGMVETANDVVPVWQITLESVKVGTISIPKVKAVVLPGDSPRTALLGMSFLKHLKMKRDGAAMIIEQKY